MKEEFINKDSFDIIKGICELNNKWLTLSEKLEVSEHKKTHDYNKCEIKLVRGK